jgi:HPt (histidine-containing phosphotransfer) domain-containing protein
MKSTRHWPRPAPPPNALNDQFDELRNAFYARLRSDRVRLTTLGAALARAEEDPVCVFEDIRVFAHRLRGAAAIFEVPEISLPAKVLEEAAGAASNAHADNSDASVWTALENLVDRLAIMSGRGIERPSDRSHDEREANAS